MIELGQGAALRPIGEHDLDELHALKEANVAHLRPWMPWAEQNRDGTAEYVHGAVAQWALGEGGAYAVVEHRRIVGTAGVHSIDRRNASTALGYWLAADAQGRGLVTRAAAALCDRCFGELALHRVEIRAHPANVRSRAVAERLGFALEGTAREAEQHPDGFRDLVVYALLATDWRARPR